MPEPKKPRRTSQKSQAAADALFDDLLGKPIDTPPTSNVAGPFDVTPDDGREFIWAEAADTRDNPFNPRVRISPKRVQTLKKSLNDNGQLQPILGRRKNGVIEIAIGHRRKAAVIDGGNAGSQLPEPAFYIGKIYIEILDLTDQQMLDYAFDENNEREDHQIFDTANYLEQLRALAPGEVGQPVSWEELVEIRAKLGKPLQWKARSIRRIVEVLRLPETLQDRLAEINLAAKTDEGDFEEKFKGVSEKHARALLMLQPISADRKSRPTVAQLAIIEQIEEELLSANETLRRAEILKADQNAGPSAPTGLGSAEPGTSNSGAGGSGSGASSSAGQATSTSSAGGSSGNSLGGKAGKESTPREKPSDPVINFLTPSRVKLETLLDLMQSGTAKVVPPSEIERECARIERLIESVRRLKGQSSKP